MYEKYDRSIRLFGIEGQETLRKIKAAVVGIGGLGTHVIQQLAYLGIGAISLIDSEKLDITNLNRYVGTQSSDVGKYKVDIGVRIIDRIDPTIEVKTVCDILASKEAFDRVINTHYVFGCLDCEGARLILNELCLAYERPYFDLASDIDPTPPSNYGGRVCFVSGDGGCLYCLGELDRAEASLILQSQAQKKDFKDIYGVGIENLGETGPSVVSINGIIASLAITEFMVHATGIRQANTLLKYYGNRGIVTMSKDKESADCYYCGQIKGRGDAVDIFRYVNNFI